MLTKHEQFEKTIEASVDESPESEKAPLRQCHTPSGNLIPLLNTSCCQLSLGPDYLCFLTAFTFFSVAGYYLVKSVNESFSSIEFRIVNALIVALQIGSYLLVALSNPGIAKVSTSLVEAPPTSQSHMNNIRYCRICKVYMEVRQFHCLTCGVCILGYDHHCPWTSKCIGRGNLYKFYVFVTVTPLYLLYAMVVMMIMLGSIAVPQPKQG